MEPPISDESDAESGPFGAGAREEDPYLECPCGAGRCSVLTSHTALNPCRKYFRCPARPGGGSCGFFKWCDTDQILQPGQVELSSQSYSFTNYSSDEVSSCGSYRSSCYRCGGEGHWARDCPNQTPNLHQDKTSKPISSYGSGSGSSFGSGSGSGTCFNCGRK